jgi:cell division protein FtsZ
MSKISSKIKVLGIGGAGVNAVSRMTGNDFESVEMIALNTDAQSLRLSRAKERILIGEETTAGLGTGMDPKLGEKAARESREKIKESLVGAEMVFLAAGFGGGTGSSVLPIVGEIAKSLNILTVAVVTRPFSFEGAQRRRIANEAVKKMKGKVDSFIVVPNDKLLKMIAKSTSVKDAFWVCDKILREAIQGISNLIFSPGIINVDLADIRGILKNSGETLFGQGIARGENRAVNAANRAIHSPLLDFPFSKAKGVLLNVAGKDDFSLFEIQEAAGFIKKASSSRAKIVFGASEEKSLRKGEIKITVIATHIN